MNQNSKEWITEKAYNERLQNLSELRNRIQKQEMALEEIIKYSKLLIYVTKDTLEFVSFEIESCKDKIGKNKPEKEVKSTTENKSHEPHPNLSTQELSCNLKLNRITDHPIDEQRIKAQQGEIGSSLTNFCYNTKICTPGAIRKYIKRDPIFKDKCIYSLYTKSYIRKETALKYFEEFGEGRIFNRTIEYLQRRSQKCNPSTENVPPQPIC